MIRLLISCCVFLLLHVGLNAQQLEQLQAQKDSLVKRGQSSIDIDRQLVALGGAPEAIVLEFVNAQQQLVMRFETYKIMPSDKVARIEGRMRSLFPRMHQLTIREQHVECVVPNDFPAADTQEILRLFGYERFTVIQPKP